MNQRKIHGRGLVKTSASIGIIGILFTVLATIQDNGTVAFIFAIGFSGAALLVYFMGKALELLSNINNTLEDIRNNQVSPRHSNQ